MSTSAASLARWSGLCSVQNIAISRPLTFTWIKNREEKKSRRRNKRLTSEGEVIKPRVLAGRIGVTYIPPNPLQGTEGYILM